METLERDVAGNGSTKPLVIFGTGSIARMAHFLFTHDSPLKVAAFTVDRARMDAERFLGLPVTAFEEIRETHPPEAFDLFVAVGYRRVNTFRAERFRQAKEMGYRLPTYISSRASTWPGLEIGENCLVLDLVVIHPFARLGDDTILWSGSHIGHDSVIGDHCYIASRAVVAGFVTVESNCFLGSNSTIRDGVTVARECVIGAGAVVTKDTRERQVYAAARSRLLPISSDRLPNL